MLNGPIQPCRNCGKEITGYVDECPACGTHKPVPVPKSYYFMGAVIIGLILYFLSDFGAIMEHFFGL